MAYSQQVYETSKHQSPKEIRFVFVSTGARRISKIIQYTYAYQFENRDVYNLGFGDYNPDLDQFEDLVTTGNSDTYKVFNTVLSTIPSFFEMYDDAILMVTGSDSGPDFARECRKTCLRKCLTCCKKFNQRVTIYRNYVDKYFCDLSLSYWFLGGFMHGNRDMTTERYIPGRKYDVIFMFKKL